MSVPLDMDPDREGLGGGARGKVASQGGISGCPVGRGSRRAFPRARRRGAPDRTRRGTNSAWSAFRRRRSHSFEKLAEKAHREPDAGSPRTLLEQAVQQPFDQE